MPIIKLPTGQTAQFPEGMDITQMEAAVAAFTAQPQGSAQGNEPIDAPVPELIDPNTPNTKSGMSAGAIGRDVAKLAGQAISEVGDLLPSSITDSSRYSSIRQAGAEALAPAIKSFVEGSEEAIANPTEVAQKTAKIFVEGIKQNPLETIGGAVGSSVGLRGGVLGSLTGGATGATIGDEFEQLLGMSPKKDIIDTFAEQLIYQGIAEGASLLAKPAVNSQLLKLADSKIKDAPFIKKLTEKFGENNVKFLITADDAGIPSAETYIKTIRDAERQLFGKEGALPSTIKTGGQQNKLLFTALSQGDKTSPFHRQLDNTLDSLKSVSKQFTKEAVTTEQFSNNVKRALTDYDKLLSIPIEDAKNRLKANYSKTIVADKFYDTVKLGLDSDTAIPDTLKKRLLDTLNQTFRPSATGKVSKQLDAAGNVVRVSDGAIKDRITLKEFEQLQTNMQDVISEFSVARGGSPEGYFLKNVFRPAQNAALDVSRITSDLPEDAVLAFAQFRDAAALKASTMKDSRLLRQLGTTDVAQSMKDMPADMLLKNTFKNPENFRTVSKTLSAVAPQAVPALKANYRKHILDQVFKGGEFSYSKLQNVMNQGNVSQRLMFKEAGGEEFLKHMDGLAVVGAALRKTGEELKGEGLALRTGGMSSIPVSTAASIESVLNGLITAGSLKGEGLAKTLNQRLYSPERLDTFLRMAKTPLDSPQGHGVFVETIKSLLPDADLVFPTEDEYYEAVNQLNSAGQQ